MENEGKRERAVCCAVSTETLCAFQKLSFTATQIRQESFSALCLEAVTFVNLRPGKHRNLDVKSAAFWAQMQHKTLIKGVAAVQ